MKFEALYYDGIHPVAKQVVIQVSDNGKTNFIGDDVSYSCYWQDVTVSSQLGNTTRILQLPSGAKCESQSQEQINQLETQYASSSFGKYLHVLESRWHYVLMASLIVTGFAWGMIVYGIPSLAKTVAHALPVSVDEHLTKGTLSILDDHILNDSELDEKTKLRINKKFQVVAENSQDNHDYQLLFRKGLGANAFALPSGHIVVTDELVEIAEHDDEVLAVLAHEIGHVIHEHGLRSVLQSSAVALLLTAVTGDVGSASGFAAAMPIILLETNYSRKFELEADSYALDYMQTHNMDTIHFANILQKITAKEDHKENDEEGNNDDDAFSYFSTHPATHERIQPFKDNSLLNK